MAVLSSTALADEMFRDQQPNTGLERVKFDAYCGNSEKVAKVLEHYGERSFIGFKSQRILNKETLAFEAILFANPKDSPGPGLKKLKKTLTVLLPPVIEWSRMEENDKKNYSFAAVFCWVNIC